MAERADGSKVPFQEALDAWARVARAFLIDTARTRGTTTTYGDLAEHVQAVTGITHGAMIQNWIGDVLGLVGEEAERRSEPHLASLCTSKEGHVRGGYPYAPDFYSQEDRDALAAQHREECYARFAVDQFGQSERSFVGLVPSEEDIAAVVEGGVVMKMHLARERNPGIRRDKIEAVKATHDGIACEACGFDFLNAYGERGRDYCEVHHRVPLSVSGETETSLEDLAILCANCHRMIHRSPFLSVEELAVVVSRQQAG